jgi:hypothetical protein
MTKIKVQFDNGGGVTCEITEAEYSHHFGDGKSAALFCNDVISGDFPLTDLDGNEWSEGIRAESNIGQHEHHHGVVYRKSSCDWIAKLSGYSAADFLAAINTSV